VRRQSPAAVVKHVLLPDFAEILNPHEADPIPSKGGVGIAPEDQEAVFAEFRQVGTADKKVEGTGLGLTLCRKFVELHGGNDLGEERVGGRIDVHVHAAGAPW